MEITSNIRIVFTPAAHAVLGQGAKFQDRLPRQFPASCSQGDFVTIAGCTATFVVLNKHWQIGPQGESLDVMLDLLESKPTLSSV